MKEKGKEEGKEKEGMAQNFPYITTEGTRCFSRMELTISPEKPVHYRSGVEEETSYSKSTTTPVTTPNKTNYYNWDVIYDSSSGSVRIDLLKSEIVTIPSSGSDSVTTSSSSSSTLSLVSKESTGEITLAGDDVGTTGESTIDAA